MSWHAKILHVTWEGKSIEWDDHGHPESGTKTMPYLDTGQAGVSMASTLFHPVGLSLMIKSHLKDVFMLFPSVNSAQWTQRKVVLRYTRDKFWDMFSCEVIEKIREEKETWRLAFIYRSPHIFPEDFNILMLETKTEIYEFCRMNPWSHNTCHCEVVSDFFPTEAVRAESAWQRVSSWCGSAGVTLMRAQTPVPVWDSPTLWVWAQSLCYYWNVSRMLN